MPALLAKPFIGLLCRYSTKPSIYRGFRLKPKNCLPMLQYSGIDGDTAKYWVKTVGSNHRLAGSDTPGT
ncbi:hypothetical protein TWF481_010278 [Arthrobotrys musiformis]|uniref:Uncharacterized protein n=1 Tax=Arthrobotrys musiformis TaxID=47236 RepID=A0AAV9W0I4_9PEZI